MLLDVLMSKEAVFLSVQGSVQQDLHRLFNTREGSLNHMPGYGLPDLHQIYDSFPKGIQNFIKTIQDKICTYEPRLANVKIQNIHHRSKQFCVLSLVINAEIIHQGKACFDGDFYSAGFVNIKTPNS